MPVEEAALTAVRGLLKSSAAYLVSGGKSGTGFFIDQGLCLTCAHVVGTVGQAVSVQPFGREPREGEVVKSSVDADLALVRVPQLPHEDEAPIAVLHLGVDDDARYYAIGYPRNDVARDAGQEEIAYRGHGRRLGPTVTLLDLEAGQASVSPGLSGGPVLSAESGAVVAIVQYRAESTPASGGGAIPIERAAATFPEVAARIVTPPITSRAWREALGREPWNALGHSWGWAVQVDLSVGGDRRQWSVRIREPWSAERSTTYNVGNIPPEIPAALFDWAQHRRIGNRADAALVGRLLSGVVMPSGTTSLKSVAAPDEVLIRLDIDAGSGLFDVPWEFLTVGDEGAERHVAFEEGFSFARVVDRADATPPDLAPAQSGALALGVIVQPTGWQREMPILRHKNPSIPWPSPAAIQERLESAVTVAAPRMRFIPALNKSPDEMLRLISSQELDATGRFEVVHYLGFGEMVRDEARIALCTTPGDAEMIPLAEFLEIVAHAKPRLLVCEFLLPRSGTQPDPLLPSAFKQALTGRLNAVVTTRFPMHPSQVDAFDGGLYQGIADGLTIEAAVQRARGVVYRNAPLNSAAAFGAYTLITGPASGMTMLAGRSGSGPQQPPPSVSASPTPSDPPKYTFKRTGAGA